MKALRIVLLSAFFCVIISITSYGQVISPVRDDFGNILLDNISKKDIPKLIDFLGQHSPICIYASKSLIELGRDSVPGLLEALKKGKNYEKVLEVLLQIPDKQAEAGLAEIIKDPSATPLPVSTLSVYGDLAVPDLAGFLSDEKRGDEAGTALCGISPSDESRRMLRKRLISDNALERGRAARVLGQWHDIQSAPNIEALLFNEDIKIRKYALAGYSVLYKQMPERYDPDLLEKFIKKETDFENLRTAVDLLATVPGKKTSESLLRIMNSEKDDKVLSRLLYDIADRGETTATLPVLQIIQDNDDPDVRAAGFYVFGKLRAEETVPYITKIMHTAKRMNPEMKLQAFEALSNIGRPVDIKDYLVYLYDDTVNCGCYTYKDALLNLVEANVRPGDKDALAFMETFKKNADGRYQEKIDSIIKKINQ